MDKFIQLDHGRQLCYREYGNPDGKPVIAFHGNPNSRLTWGVFPEAVNTINVRLIAPDRPGYGKTDFETGITTLESWPKDILALSNHLGIEKFAVFGVSGGGLYALSCGWAIPERITCVGIFGSIGPYMKETKQGVNTMTIAK